MNELMTYVSDLCPDNIDEVNVMTRDEWDIEPENAELDGIDAEIEQLELDEIDILDDSEFQEEIRERLLENIDDYLTFDTEESLLKLVKSRS